MIPRPQTNPNHHSFPTLTGSGLDLGKEKTRAHPFDDPDLARFDPQGLGLGYVLLEVILLVFLYVHVGCQREICGIMSVEVITCSNSHSTGALLYHRKSKLVSFASSNTHQELFRSGRQQHTNPQPTKEPRAQMEIDRPERTRTLGSP